MAPLSNRRLNPTCRTTPASRAASMARSASGSVTAIGFSQNTCRPAAAAATTRSACDRAGAATTTASTAGSSRAWATSVYARSAPSGPASRSAAPGAGSTTAASRACGRRRASASAWKAPIRPDPIRATPTVSLAIPTPLLERSRPPSAWRALPSSVKGMRLDRSSPAGYAPLVTSTSPDRRPTLADVAARAGVSTALVSIVMRDVPGASAATRERVRRAADEIGYRPDTRARLLRSSRSQLLRVVFGVQHAFHGDLLAGLYDAAEQAGYELALSAVTPGRGEQRAVDSLLRARCEALVLLGPSSPTAHLTDLAT